MAFNITPYLENNKVTANTWLNASRASSGRAREIMAAMFAYGMPGSGRIDPSGERVMSEYFSQVPIGNEIMRLAGEAGMGERSFLDALRNRKTNYTYAIGPALQSRINSYAQGMNTTPDPLEQLRIQTPQATQAATPAAATPAVDAGGGKYADIKGAKNLRRALKKAGNVLSKGELDIIAKKFKVSAEDVLTRAASSNMAIGSAVINRYQAGKYTDPMTAMARSQGYITLDPLQQQLQNIGKLNKGSVFFSGAENAGTALPRSLFQIQQPAQQLGGGGGGGATTTTGGAGAGGVGGGGNLSGPGSTQSQLHFQSILNQLNAGQGQSLPTMPTMPQFSNIPTQVSTPTPVQLAQLGIAYGTGGIRARGYKGKKMKEYRRQSSSTQPLAISPIKIR